MSGDICYNTNSIFSIAVTRAVAWPPKNPEILKKSDGTGAIISSAAKKYVKSVESANSENHGQYSLSRGNYFRGNSFTSYKNNFCYIK